MININNAESVKLLREQLCRETGVAEEDVAMLITKVIRANNSFGTNASKVVAIEMGKALIAEDLPADPALIRFLLLNLGMSYLMECFDAIPQESRELCMKTLMERAKSAPCAAKS